MPRQPLPERAAPRVAVEGARRRRWEEHPGHRPEVVAGVPEPRRVRRPREVGVRRQHVGDQGLAEELVNPLPRLAHDGVRIEVRPEDGGHVVEQLPLLPRLAERRRGPHADQVLPGAEPQPQPPDEAGEVGPLRPVEGVQLVHHQVAQRAGFVPPPEPLVRRPDQQVVQHLVVRQQDVRRRPQQRLPVRDHPLRPHPGRPRPRLRVLPDEEPPPSPAPRSPGIRWMVAAMRPAWSVASAFIG